MEKIYRPVRVHKMETGLHFSITDNDEKNVPPFTSELDVLDWVNKNKE